MLARTVPTGRRYLRPRRPAGGRVASCHLRQAGDMPAQRPLRKTPRNARASVPASLSTRWCHSGQVRVLVCQDGTSRPLSRRATVPVARMIRRRHERQYVPAWPGHHRGGRRRQRPPQRRMPTSHRPGPPRRAGPAAPAAARPGMRTGAAAATGRLARTPRADARARGMAAISPARRRHSDRDRPGQPGHGGPHFRGSRSTAASRAARSRAASPGSRSPARLTSMAAGSPAADSASASNPAA